MDARVWHPFLGLNLGCTAYWPGDFTRATQCLRASVSPSANWGVGAPWHRGDRPQGCGALGTEGELMGGMWLSCQRCLRWDPDWKVGQTPAAQDRGHVGLAGFRGSELAGSPRVLGPGVLVLRGSILQVRGCTGARRRPCFRNSGSFGLNFFLSSDCGPGASLQEPHEKRDVIPIRQMRALRLREVK